MGRVKHSVLASTADFGAVVAALGHEEFERVANQCLNALRAERMRHAGSGGAPCDFVDDAALAVACTCVKDLEAARIRQQHAQQPRYSILWAHTVWRQRRAAVHVGPDEDFRKTFWKLGPSDENRFLEIYVKK